MINDIFAIKEATSRFVNLEKVRVSFPSSSFSMCFSNLVKYYSEVSFNFKATLYVANDS